MIPKRQRIPAPVLMARLEHVLIGARFEADDDPTRDTLTEALSLLAQLREVVE